MTVRSCPSASPDKSRTVRLRREAKFSSFQGLETGWLPPQFLQETSWLPQRDQFPQDSMTYCIILEPFVW